MKFSELFSTGTPGLLMEDNDDAKALSAAVMEPIPDCSGAMHQACTSAALFIAKNGWETYVDKMRERTDKE